MEGIDEAKVKFGSYQFSSGTMYRGDNPFNKNKKFGWLKYSSNDFMKYYGLFNDNVFVGIKHFQKSKSSYPGVWVNDGKDLVHKANFNKIEKKKKLNGKYTIVYKNNDFYSGDILDGKRNGFGVYITEEGYIYKGRWLNNERSGENASAVFNNGNVYNGSWRRDKILDKGVLYLNEGFLLNEWVQKNRGLFVLKGKKVLDDRFLAEKLNTRIEYFLKNEDTLFAEFKDDIEEYNSETDSYSESFKKGNIDYGGNYYKRTYTSSVFEGYMLNDKYEGKGTIKYFNNDYYKGNFKNGVFFGKGAYMFNDGSSLEGFFYTIHFDILVLEGKMTFKNGEVFKGKIQLGQNYTQNTLESPLSPLLFNSFFDSIDVEKEFTLKIVKGELIKVNQNPNSIEVLNAKEPIISDDLYATKNIFNRVVKKSNSNYSKIKIIFGVIVVVIIIIFIFSTNDKRDSNKKEIKSQDNQAPILADKISKHPIETNISSLSENEFKKEIERRFLKISSYSNEIFWVKDKDRKHAWSLIPGGCTVVVMYKNKACRGYDKVKKPHSYVKSISREYLVNTRSNKKHISIEQFISEIYLAGENSVDISEVWNSDMGINPWKVLEEYKDK